VSVRSWPEHWQPDAIAAIEPYVGSDYRLEVLVGDPATSVSGTLLAGYLYDSDKGIQVIHDRSRRPDVYPWPLLAGPVLRATACLPKRSRTVVFQHPDWSSAPRPSLPALAHR